MLSPRTLGKKKLTQYLASIVESSEDAVMGMDAHGIILSWNTAAEQLLGHSPSDILGRPIRALIPAPFYDE